MPFKVVLNKNLIADRRKQFGPGSVLVEVKQKHPLTILKGTTCGNLLKMLKEDLGCNGHVVTEGAHAPALAFQGGTDLGKRLVLWLKRAGRWSTARTYQPIPAIDLTIPLGHPLTLDLDAL